MGAAEGIAESQFVGWNRVIAHLLAAYNPAVKTVMALGCKQQDGDIRMSHAPGSVMHRCRAKSEVDDSASKALLAKEGTLSEDCATLI